MNNQIANKKLIPMIVIALLLGVPMGTVAAKSGEFPQKNAWARVTPSVVYCGDPTSTVTIEVHIVGRSDVARVWVTNLDTADVDARGELFDDGTHGDAAAGDNIFTLKDIVLCDETFPYLTENGYSFWMGLLDVQLKNGTELGNQYGISVGLVDPAYRGAFGVQDYGNGLSATAYAFFIADSAHEVFSDYPVADVTCGKSNFAAFRKLYSVLPDNFDFALVMPGMQMLRTGDLGEQVPYEINVKNEIQHIGLNLFDNTNRFGSAGRLRSAVYHSFGGIDIVDHEIAHAWGASLGGSLGLLDPGGGIGHWNDLSDSGGQLGAYYFADNGLIGRFHYNGDETWYLVENSEIEAYSLLEWYLMGLAFPGEVPPIHILQSPNLTDPLHITAASYRTVTIGDIIKAEGGERIPSAAESQKNFTMAFIVSQDIPFTDAAYAYFSLLSYELVSKNPPKSNCCTAPFYWATDGRATLETHLPLDLSVPQYLPGDPLSTPESTDTLTPAVEATFTETVSSENGSSPTIPARPDASPTAKSSQATPVCNPIPIGLVFLPGILILTRKQKSSR